MTPDNSGDAGHEQLESVLRATMHSTSSPSHGETERLLRTLHRRTARRRARRRAAGATVMLVGVAGAAALVATWPPSPGTVPTASTPESLASPMAATSPTDQPDATVRTTKASPPTTPVTTATATTTPSATKTSPQPGQLVEPADVDVTSVTAVRRASFWVLGTTDCPQGRCSVIAHTDDAGRTFDFRSAPDADPEPTLASAPTSDAVDDTDEPVADLRYAVNGTDAWRFGGELWSTHDAGRSWSLVDLPVPADVTSVQAWGGTVWAFGTAISDGTPLVFSSPVTLDGWSTADLRLGSTDRLDTPVVADGVVAAVVTSADGSSAFVRSLDGGATWDELPLPTGCVTPVASSGVESAVWLYCLTADDALAAVTSDAGTTWSAQPLSTPTSDLTTMTGIDASHALVTDAATLSRVTLDGGVTDGEVTDGVEPVTGPFDAADDVWSGLGYTYAGFTDPQTGYLITSGGELARSADGGRDWTPVSLP